MHRIIDIFTTYEPFIWLAIGVALPYVEKQLERLAKSEQYQLAREAYNAIDPAFLEKMGGKYKFLQLIKEAIKAASDRELTHAEIKSLSKLVIANFQLEKALESSKK